MCGKRERDRSELSLPGVCKLARRSKLETNPRIAITERSRRSLNEEAQALSSLKERKFL